ncbi:MAG: tetratricopeptide repeat protein [Lachnospiraceae bacterium]|nr:tetratricopeptide repeat protein [Lachnospiraceae bacterium]
MSRKDLKYILMITAASAAVLTGCGKGGSTLFEEGMEAVARQEYRTALDDFSGALRIDSDKEQVYRGMGLAYMGREEYARALGAFSKALSEAGMYPGELEFDINYYMAICYYKLGEYDNAIACYDAITDLRRKETRAYFLRGNMRLCLNDVEGAMADFDSAASLKKNDYSLYLDIYDSMMQHDYVAQAETYLDIVKAGDQKLMSDYDKGRLCYYTGEYTRACNYLERARGTETDAERGAELISLLCECYKMQGQYDYATIAYSGYVEDYNDAQICDRLGLCYVDQGDYAKALEAFEKGKEIKENNTCMQELCLNEIACYEYMGEYEKARVLLAEYMETYGSNEDLDREYAFLSTR